jgi:hypothetical protein
MVLYFSSLSPYNFFSNDVIIGSAIHIAINIIAATRPIVLNIPSGGSLPIAVRTIITISIPQNQYLNAPRRDAGTELGLLSKKGKKTKITCANPNNAKPRSILNGRKIS